MRVSKSDVDLFKQFWIVLYFNHNITIHFFVISFFLFINITLKYYVIQISFFQLQY